MRFASASEIYALDAAARAAAWVPPGSDPSEVLMRLAARALADRVRAVAARMPVRPAVLALCGAGDNGRDAAMALDLLAREGFETQSFTVPGTFAPAFPPGALPSPLVVLDGILGIGLKGPPRPPAGAAVRWLATARRAAAPGAFHVIAVDIPSGLAPDAEAVAPDTLAVRADETLSMGLPKRVFAAQDAIAFTGEIRVADIGYPDSAFAPDEADAAALFAERDLALARPRRAWDANKGDFGRVALFAGSARYPGAAMLATLGALRGGAGLVSSFVPEACVPAFAARAPEAVFGGWRGKALSSAALSDLAPDLAGSVVAVGPGLSRGADAAGAVRWLLSSPQPAGFVLDADALFALGVLPRGGAPRLADGRPAILTPHPGEAARLLGCPVADVQADRAAAARALAERSGATALLKGAGTLVASPGRPVSLVAAGTPALAKGGSGDILCGLCAALLARGLGPHEAACAAALLHGRAAAAAALSSSPDAFLPTDLLAALA